MQLASGTNLQNGKYRIIRVLGQGGFGITYLAEHTFLEKKVAIKEFFPRDFCGRDNTSHLTLGTQNNEEIVEKLKARFLKEAKNIAKLSHPGIIKILDIFEENDTAYYVMDYIEGANLNDLIKLNGPLNENKAIWYIRKVSDALDYIHSKKMTHFDVKPANIVIRNIDNEPILIDFGLSKQYDIHGDATSTLMQGVSQGYSPIELYNAGSIATFSPQTDIYSLGATLLFMLTGTTPPSASQILEDGLQLPTGLNDEVSKVITTCMEVSRAKRPRQISELKYLFSKFDSDDNVLFAQQDSDTVVSSDIIDEDEDTQLLSSETNEDACKEYEEEVNNLKSNISTLETEKKGLEEEIEELNDENEKKNKTKNIFRFLFFAVSLLLIVSTSMCSNRDNDLSSAKNKIGDLKEKISTQKKIITTIAGNQPVFIESIEVRNSGEEYGAKIYSKNATYIYPRIKVTNYSDENKTLGIKFYSPYGLRTGDISYNGYSYTEELPAYYSGWLNISGWGYGKKGSFPAGNYKIEIWNNNKCIDSISFKVY